MTTKHTPVTPLQLDYIVHATIAYRVQDRKDAAAMLAYARGRGQVVSKRQCLLAGLAGFQRTIERS